MQKTIFLILILILFSLSISFAQQESVTITTYYPSPYGSYKELNADQMAIGSNYRHNTLTDGLLIVSGSVGVGTPSPSLGRLEVRSGGDTIYGESTSGRGIIGISYTSGDISAVYGENFGSGVGTYGGSAGGRGVVGDGTGSTGIGVQGYSDYRAVFGEGRGQNSTGVYGTGGQYGVRGLGWGTAAAAGVYGESTSSKGVYGKSTSADGVYGESASGRGVYGQGRTYGVYGDNMGGTGIGVYGASLGIGVEGLGTIGVKAQGGPVGPNIGLEANGHIGIRTTGGVSGIEATGPLAGSFKGRVYIDGDAQITGTLTMGGAIVGGDVAEDIICPGCVASDVVVIDSQKKNGYKKSAQPYDPSVVGIISGKPSLYLNRMEGKKSAQPLALIGVVKCKVVTEGGFIKSGDFLVTSSKPGYAMRADLEKTKPGMIVAKALEPLEKGEGEILVLIK
jgi:hypothetical protein